MDEETQTKDIRTKGMKGYGMSEEKDRGIDKITEEKKNIGGNRLICKMKAYRE